MRIAVLGGGPGGLFAAILAKDGRDDREVTVFERNRAEDTFGFGVVFSDATLENIHAADPVLRDALEAGGVHWDPIEVRLHGERWLFRGNGMAAVERRTLLGLLQERAGAAGVDLRYSTDVDPARLLEGGYDLVVAADGANSRLRDAYADVFEPWVDTATAKFIWLGTTYPFDGLTFVHERGEHGVFAVHGYPIGGGVSTFIVETDEDTWRAAGLDSFDVTQAPGPSDGKSKAYLQELFADQVEGHPLLVNNSRWGNFRTRGARTWRHRVGSTAIALLGDAAHTAHFSVGSGTKMAMEDAVALAAALDAHGDDVDSALAEYEAVRQPQVDKIQGSARPSLSWWEHFGRTHDALPAWQFAYHFLSRSLTERKLRRRDDTFVTDVHARWAQAHGAEPLRTPLKVADQLVTARVVTVTDDSLQLPDAPLPLHDRRPDDVRPWGLWVDAPDTEDQLGPALDAVAQAADHGAALVAVRGGTALTRRLLCEAARLEHGVVSLLVEPVPEEQVADVALTAVLSGRTDLFAVTSAAPGPEADR